MASVYSLLSILLTLVSSAYTLNYKYKPTTTSEPTTTPTSEPTTTVARVLLLTACTEKNLEGDCLTSGIPADLCFVFNPPWFKNVSSVASDKQGDCLELYRSGGCSAEFGSVRVITLAPPGSINLADFKFDNVAQSMSNC